MTEERRTPAPDVTVVMVTWNVRDVALRSLELLLERAGGLDLEVIVVDNASRDGTVEAIRSRHPGVVVIANRENVGFARGCNQGLDAARGRHLLLLNPDAWPGDARTLVGLVGALDRDPTLGAVGPRIEYPDGVLQAQCGRRDYRLRHLVWEALYLHVLFPRNPIFSHQLMGDWDHRGRREVEAISGAFLLVRTRAARMAGGIPEDVFLYYDDLALCLRLRRRGWRIECLGDLTAVHEGGSSTRQHVAPVYLFEGEVRVRLIRERSGPFWGLLSRVLMGTRSLMRLGIALALWPVPGLESMRKERPRIFQARRHALLLVWSVWPSRVRRALPTAPSRPDRGPRILLIGPTPPPAHGNSVWTATVLGHPRVRAALEVEHLDTSDRRTISNLGTFDLRNVALAVRHALELSALRRRFRPSVVYVPLSQNAMGFLRDALLIRIASGRGAKVVVHLHGGELDRFLERCAGPLRAVVRSTARRIEEGWVLAEGLRPQFASLLPAERVRVVPNGVRDWTTDPCVGPERERPPVGRSGRVTEPGPIRVLYLGQLSRKKGVFDLFDALTSLEIDGSRVRLLLAGSWLDPAQAIEAAACIGALQAEGIDVEEHGVADDALKARLLGSTDLFVLPSLAEGQPLTILEAMAGGLPVVATRAGGVPDLVVDGETGVLVEPGNVPALREALQALARNGEERRRMGRAARIRYLERFTDDRLAERLVSAFRDVAERERAL